MRPYVLNSLLLVAASVVGARLGFAGVLTVGPTGAAHTEIQSAVQAALPGDLILVATGSYGPVTVDGKALTICADFGAVVTIQGTTRVRNLTAGQLVVVSGVVGLGQTSTALDAEAGAALVVANNAGLVRIENCTFTGANGSNVGLFSQLCCEYPWHDEGWDGARVFENSAGVAFVDSTLVGGRGVVAPVACVCGFGAAGGDGLRASASVVALYDTTCRGGAGGDQGYSGGDGGAGCRTQSGGLPTGLFASGSSFRGGDGGDGYDGVISEGGDGGTGFHVASSTSAQFLDDDFAGGAFGLAAFGIFPPGSPGVGLVNSGSTFTYPVTSLELEVPSLARSGLPIPVRVTCTPGEIVRLVVSNQPQFQIVPSWRGTRLASITTPHVDVVLGVIPATGELRTRYVLPPLHAGIASRTFYAQAYRAHPIDGPTYAAGSTITVVP